MAADAGRQVVRTALTPDTTAVLGGATDVGRVFDEAPHLGVDAGDAPAGSATGPSGGESG